MTTGLAKTKNGRQIFIELEGNLVEWANYPLQRLQETCQASWGFLLSAIIDFIWPTITPKFHYMRTYFCHFRGLYVFRPVYSVDTHRRDGHMKHITSFLFQFYCQSLQLVYVILLGPSGVFCHPNTSAPNAWRKHYKLYVFEEYSKIRIMSNPDRTIDSMIEEEEKRVMRMLCRSIL